MAVGDLQTCSRMTDVEDSMVNLWRWECLAPSERSNFVVVVVRKGFDVVVVVGEMVCVHGRPVALPTRS